MRNNIERTFDAMLKAAPCNYDYNWSFNCSLDIKYDLDTYLGFNVFKWKLLKKDTIIFCDTCEITKKEWLIE